MEKLLPPYRIEISTSILCIYFDKIVTADVFFANCADIQQILEEGTYLGIPFKIYTSIFLKQPGLILLQCAIC